MAAPNLISTRRLPGSVRMRLQVVFARAWEALAETYQIQAVEFVRRLRGRLPFDEALDRYFREIGVPAARLLDDRGAVLGRARARALERLVHQPKFVLVHASSIMSARREPIKHVAPGSSRTLLTSAGPEPTLYHKVLVALSSARGKRVRLNVGR